jgi:NADH-ubiquinone oxidoreductase chain 5
LRIIFIRLRLNFFFLSFFHLISHAIFKSLLFLNGGVILHSFFRGQDSRIFNRNLQSEILIKIRTICSLFNLIGLAFLRGFFSKDALLERISTSISIFLIGIFFFSLFLTFTFIYSLRLLRIAFFSKSYFLLLKLERNYLTIFVPLIFLSILRLLRGIFFSQYHLIFCLSPSIFKFFIFNLFIIFFRFLIPYLIINLLFQLSNSSIFSLSIIVNYLRKFPFLINFLKLNFELGLFKYIIFVISNYFFNKKISYRFSYYGLGIYLFFFITILLFF